MALITAAASVTADQSPAVGDFIGAASVQYQIEFGQGVHVQLEADVSTNVTEVRAVFSALGERRVSSYAYPSFRASPGITAGSARLSASFTINTGGSAYVPPGTEFELVFELTSTDGSVTATEAERILYLDPSKSWRQISAPGAPLDLHYYGFSDSTAQDLVSTVSANWMSIASSIGVDTASVGRFRAVVYPNQRELNAVFPPTSAAASDGGFFGAFAMQRYGVLVLGGPSQSTVLHELTHLLVGTMVNSPLSPGVPSWLNEGLAQFYEAGSSSGYTSQLSRAAAEDRLITLRNRNNVPARGSEIGLFYTQVGSFVGQLIEDFGPEPMAETLRLINDGSIAADAVDEAYGTPLWALENDWRVRLGASELPPPPQPTVEPAQATSTPAAVGTGPVTPASPVAQSTPTVALVPGSGVVVSEEGITGGEVSADPEDGFNWTGPIIGAAAAAFIFFIWSFRTNRRRFRSSRR